jgi:phage major head subunit gpT-like protein
MTTEMLTRRAATFRPRTFDEAGRTVEVVFSTGAPVTRHDAKGAYREVLSLDSGHVDLSGMAGAPVLNAHAQGALGAVLGVIERAWIEAGEGRALLRLSARPDVAPLIGDIRDGIIRSVSVGYSVQEWRETADRQTGQRTRTAVRWRPAEISFVPVPADAGAHVRSHNMPDTNIESAARGGAARPAEAQASLPGAAAGSSSFSPAAAQDNRGAINGQIRSLAGTLNLGSVWADSQIDAGATVEAARGAALDAMMQRQQQIPARQIGDSNDDPGVIRLRMEGALAHRLNASIALPDDARQFAGLGLADMARGLLSARGEAGLAFLGRETLLTRAVGTGDLPILLTGTGNRVLQAAYQAAPNPLRRLARQVTATDFRTRSTVRFGEFGKLQRVAEHGELQRLGTAELAEAFALDTYGGTFALTRQAIINDDLGAFARVTGQMGLAAAETEADLLVKLLTQGSGLGPNMSDGQRLFNAAHGNVSGTGAVISETTLDAARQAMRGQKGLDGKTPINATPAFLLVSPARETAAEKLLTAIQAATTSDVNPFGGRLQLLVEPRLTGNRWYVFANPETLAVLEYAYLAGAPGPQMDSRQGWDVLGVEFRVYLDFGCGAVDWRGAYTNAGG